MVYLGNCEAREDMTEEKEQSAAMQLQTHQFCVHPLYHNTPISFPPNVCVYIFCVLANVVLMYV